MTMNVNLQELKKRILREAALAITLESDKLSVALVSEEKGERDLFTLPIGFPGLVRPIGIIHRKGKRLAPVVGRFVEQLQKPDDTSVE